MSVVCSAETDGGQVTETVGPSVVKTQKSSDKFCGIEWTKRKGEETSQSCSVSVSHTYQGGITTWTTNLVLI